MEGYTPDLRERLKIIDSGKAKTLAQSLSKNEGIPSGPAVVLFFMFRKAENTSCSLREFMSKEGQLEDEFISDTLDKFDGI